MPLSGAWGCNKAVPTFYHTMFDSICCHEGQAFDSICCHEGQAFDSICCHEGQAFDSICCHEGQAGNTRRVVIHNFLLLPGLFQRVLILERLWVTSDSKAPTINCFAPKDVHVNKQLKIMCCHSDA